MPRQARIDDPGALQFVLIRGIERGAIFKNNTDETTSSIGWGICAKNWLLSSFPFAGATLYQGSP